MMVAYCDTAKCKSTGDDKREIRIDYIPEAAPLRAQPIPCPYCEETIVRHVGGEVKRVTGDKDSNGRNVFFSTP
jgi:hypothetical protein